MKIDRNVFYHKHLYDFSISFIGEMYKDKGDLLPFQHCSGGKSLGKWLQ